MTEEEAKTKWCPMSRQYVMNATADDVGDVEANTFHGETTCVGSQCMAWRTYNHGPKQPECPDGIYQSGFCGLAGKP